MAGERLDLRLRLGVKGRILAVSGFERAQDEGEANRQQDQQQSTANDAERQRVQSQRGAVHLILLPVGIT